jgi:hypothetical protein
MPKHMPRSLVSQPGWSLCKLTASRVNLQGDLQQVLSMVFIAYVMAENIDTMRDDLMQSWYLVDAVELPVLDRGWRYCGL